MQPGGWTVDFWFDPACPLSRLTARWLGTVAEHRPVTIRWRVMSLSILNEHAEVDPEGDEAGYLWIPARVGAAVQTGHGHAALGRFYDELWTDAHGAPREWLDDIPGALTRAGLPAALAEAGFGTEYDAALRASHTEGVDLAGPGVGTPVLAIAEQGSDGPRRALFGPVVAEVPEPGDALRLWEGTLLVAGVPGFREIKRPRG